MGTQQILLIVLSVIIVGIALTGGLSMFNQQSMNNNRSAIIADLNYIGANSLTFYRSPKSTGGGEHHWIPFDDEGSVDKSKANALGQWLNYDSYEESASGDKFYSLNGVFWMNLESWTSDELIIIGSGTERGFEKTYNSAGHGETGCIEVELRVSGASKKFSLKVLN